VRARERARIRRAIFAKDGAFSPQISRDATMKIFGKIFGLSVLFATLAIGAAGATPLYQVTAIKNFSGNSVGLDMNDSGQVAGVATGADRAFITEANGANPTLVPGSLGSGHTVGFAINNSGQVAGNGQPTNGSFDHAFITDAGGGNIRDLGTLGGAFAVADRINASGQVAGSSTVASGKVHAFVTGANGNGMRDLGTLGGDVSSAHDVNDKGQVTGTAATTVANQNHAFIATVDAGGVHMTDIGALKGGTFSSGNAINESGRIVGVSGVEGGARHAFVTGANGAGMIDIGTLGGNFTLSEALDINDDGLVVGVSSTTGFTDRAFLFDGTAMLDLNDLIDPTDPLFSDLILEKALAINDDGQILVTGSRRSDLTPLTFILTPEEDVADVPEPMSLVLAFGGLVGLGCLHRRGQKYAGR
jgi:probable HAF family extracellular repeat protein